MLIIWLKPQNVIVRFFVNFLECLCFQHCFSDQGDHFADLPGLLEKYLPQMVRFLEGGDFYAESHLNSTWQLKLIFVTFLCMKLFHLQDK